MSRLVFNIPRELPLQQAKTVLYEMKIVGVYACTWSQLSTRRIERMYVCIYIYMYARTMYVVMYATRFVPNLHRSPYFRSPIAALDNSSNTLTC